MSHLSQTSTSQNSNVLLLLETLSNEISAHCDTRAALKDTLHQKRKSDQILNKKEEEISELHNTYISTAAGFRQAISHIQFLVQENQRLEIHLMIIKDELQTEDPDPIENTACISSPDLVLLEGIAHEKETPPSISSPLLQIREEPCDPNDFIPFPSRIKDHFLNTKSLENITSLTSVSKSNNMEPQTEILGIENLGAEDTDIGLLGLEGDFFRTEQYLDYNHDPTFPTDMQQGLEHKPKQSEKKLRGRFLDDMYRY